MTNLGSLPGSNSSIAFGASSDGSVIAGQSFSTATSSDEPARWTSAGGWVGLGFLPGGGAPGTVSAASAVSADGSTVVGQSLNASSINEAFRWTSSGGMVGLGFLPGGTASSAFAVSRDGSVIVGYGGSDAFRWTSGGGMQSLGFFGAARGVSADGSTVVGDDFGSTVFLWTQESGTRSLADILTKDYGLNLSGWTLTFAAGISADGNTIIGEGTDPSGHTEGWIATIPEPGTGLLVMSGVLSLAITRRGRRGVSA